MNPRFSVIIPAYNREKLIVATVNSILAQTFNSFEIIVVDDGSKDDTVKVLGSFGDRVKTLAQANQGAEAARARGAVEAKGEYLAFLDDDDLLSPSCLQVYDRIINELGAPPLILGQMSYFQNDSTPLLDKGGSDFIEVLKYQDYLCRDVALGLSCSRMVVKKSVYDASAAMRNLFKGYPLDDHHLMLSIGTSSPCIVVTQPTTVAHRVHASNFSRNVDLIVAGVLSMIQFERKGLYPGGPARRFGRYACIGGVAWWWGKQAIKRRHYALVLRLFIKGSPHLAAGAVKKLYARVRAAGAPVRLPR